MPNSVSPPTDPAELAERLGHVARRLRRGASAELAPLGLTGAQARVLRALAAAAGPLKMAELAARLEVVPRSATSMVDGLEAAGLARRHHDPADRRLVRVAPTAAGTALLERLDAARRDGAERVFGSLAPPERAELARLLEALCQRGCCPACGAGAGDRR